MRRVHRLPLDRLLNLGIATQRLRCNSPTCAYEFLKKPQTLAANTRPWMVGSVVATIAIALGLAALSPLELPSEVVNASVAAEQTTYEFREEAVSALTVQNAVSRGADESNEVLSGRPESTQQ